MAFSVSTTRTADDQLADLWVRASPSRRRAITAASLRIEKALARAADTIGVPRPTGQLPTARRLDEPPLAVVFMLHQSSRTAVILDFLDVNSP